MTRRRHLYELDNSIMAQQDFDVVTATLSAMDACDILHLPYPELDVRVWTPALLNNRDYFPKITQAVTDDDDLCVWTTFTLFDEARFSNGKLQIGMKGTAVVTNRRHQSHYLDLMRRMEGEESLTALGVVTAAKLLVALASRNTEKSREENKRIKLGINPLPQFRGQGVTYISCTRLAAPTVHESTGRKMPMHLRAGHPHTFRYGMGRQHSYIKFIPPLWVNRDDNAPQPAPHNYRVMGT